MATHSISKSGQHLSELHVHPGRPTAFDRVFIATDFSAGAAQALERAARLPLARRARLTIAHVLGGDEVESRAEAEAVARGRLDQERERVASLLPVLDRSDVTVSAELRHGVPHIEIVRGARLAGAELIVLGRHGARRFKDLLIGSTAERVIAVGDLPILVVNRRPRRGYHRPLLAVELTDASVPLITLGLSVLDTDVSDATLLHAYHVPFDGPSASGRDVPQATPLRDEYHALVASRLAALQSSARAFGVKWRRALVQGDAPGAILTEAARRRVDLITVGTHGRSGVARALVGSVARDVVRAATCDVLVGRPVRVAFDIA